VYLGLFDAVSSHGPAAFAAMLAAVFLGLTGALALACFVKVCGVVFLGLPRTRAAEQVHECGWRMRLPMLGLGAACVAIGLAPAWFLPALTAAAAAWRPDLARPDSGSAAPLAVLGAFHLALAVLVTALAVLLWRRVRRNGVERAGTWDCGYAAPTPRMQYTAGSFAGIITGWFAWILRPVRQEHPPRDFFPAAADYAEHTPETVLEKVVEPAGRGVMRISAAARALQDGRVQSYIFYLLLGLAALGVLAVIGGAK
jgi:hydrogenase-4 component B